MDQQIGKTQGFLNLLKNLIMKIYAICCVPAQIPYFRKSFFLRCGPKCSPYLLNKSMQEPDFWHVDTNSHELKVDQKDFT